MSEFRHEYKYVSSLEQMEYIKNSIGMVMDLDAHVDEQGEYTVRSVYFDDYYDTCYYDNIYGTDPREKFRIRIYNADSSKISLELKQKQRGKTKKLSCILTNELCEEIIKGKIPDIDAIDSALYRKFILQLLNRNLQPKIIVEYDRIPYTYYDGNVRVTFDKNIRSSIQCRDFLKKELFIRPIMETNQHLIEVKFDEFLPDFIEQLVTHEELRQSSFSKYFLCRKYSLRGIV